MDCVDSKDGLGCRELPDLDGNLKLNCVPVDEQSGVSLNSFSLHDKCWLCQRVSKADDRADNGDYSAKSRDGTLHELLPWLCKSCEKTIEDEERKVEPGLSLPSFVELDDDSMEPSAETPCLCETCTKARESELEQAQQIKELENNWTELSSVIRGIYYADNSESASNEDCYKLADVGRLHDLIGRLCTQDADRLYQRLGKQVRDVVIDMKVKLLKELTIDQKAIHRAHQFLTLLLAEYARLCAASQRAAAFLAVFERHYLSQFELTWQLHDKHLFHSIIYSDPVVQNCLPKVVNHIRSTLVESDDGSQVACSQKTLVEYGKLDSEMSVVGAVWTNCKQLIERYNEQQAALRLKQKMFKEDWAFFKAQRRLLEQAVPQSRTVSSRCCFDVQFNDLMKSILQGGRKPVDVDQRCPLCNQLRCPCDECNISHMITCGLISPEVSEELAATQQCRYQLQKQQEQEAAVLCETSMLEVASPALVAETNLESVTQMSTGSCGRVSGTPTLPLPLSYDPLRYLVNVKPPSMPSSTSSSRSESPIMLDHYRFMMPFGDNFEMPEDLASDDDGNFFEQHLNKDGSCGNVRQSCSLSPKPVSMLEKDVFSEVIEDTSHSSTDTVEGVLKEARPSSLIARMKMAAVNLSADKSTCTCPHCMMNNGTLCMFEAARRTLSESQKSASKTEHSDVAVDRLQLSHVGAIRRLLNPQLYELHALDVIASDCTEEIDVSDTTTLAYENNEQPSADVGSLTKNRSLGEICDSKLMESSGFSSEMHSDSLCKTQPKSGAALGDSVTSDLIPHLRDECVCHCNVDDVAVQTSIEDGVSGNTPCLMSPIVCVRGSQSHLKPADDEVSVMQAICNISSDLSKVEKPLSIECSVSGALSESDLLDCQTVVSNNAVIAPSSLAVRATQPIISAVSKLDATAQGSSMVTASSRGHSPRVSVEVATTPKHLPCKAPVLPARHIVASPSMSPSVKSPVAKSEQCKHFNTLPMASVFNGAAKPAIDINPSLGGRNPKGTPTIAAYKDAAAAMQCCGGKASELTLTTILTSGTADGQNVSTGCSSSTGSGCGSSVGSASGSGNVVTQKDGKFCECWHCEFFGQALQSSLPSKRESEARERLRQRLQKKKQSKTNSTHSVHSGNEMISGQTPSPLGSPRSDILNDKELEEIIKFINGVDNAMAAATARAEANGKQKTAKQKLRKIKDTARIVESSSLAQKEETGPAETPISDSPVSSISGSGLPSKKSRQDLSGSSKSCNSDLAAQLSTRLAQLMDVAAASQSTKASQCDQLARGIADGLRENSPIPCNKESSLLTTAVCKHPPNALTDSLQRVTMVGKPAVSECQSVSKPVAIPSQSNGSTVAATEDVQSSSLVCKSKRQKQMLQKVDDITSFDDIFLPSEETGRHETGDEFDREIEEFKRFCYNSTLMRQKQERPRVTLNVKDIFVRKKTTSQHGQGQGCSS